MSKNKLLSLLSAVHAANLFFRAAHWSAAGTSFYGNHLMLDRIYTSLSGIEDRLAERVVLATNSPIDACSLLMEAGVLCGDWGDDFAACILQIISLIDEALADENSTGTANLLQGISDELESSLYLVMGAGPIDVREKPVGAAADDVSGAGNDRLGSLSYLDGEPGEGFPEDEYEPFTIAGEAGEDEPDEEDEFEDTEEDD